LAQLPGGWEVLVAFWVILDDFGPWLVLMFCWGVFAFKGWLKIFQDDQNIFPTFE
jgi:hypothetical protein